MRLISQVAKDIYECDHKKITRYPGDILSYKTQARAGPRLGHALRLRRLHTSRSLL